jgi:type VI protein secretion system component Hcp
MTARSTIRKLVPSLFASLVAALAIWPLSAEAKSNTSRVTNEIHFVKHFDKATPRTQGGVVQSGWNLAQNKRAARTTGSTSGKGQKYMRHDMKNTYISQ